MINWGGGRSRRIPPEGGAQVLDNLSGTGGIEVHVLLLLCLFVQQPHLRNLLMTVGMMLYHICLIDPRRLNYQNKVRRRFCS